MDNIVPEISARHSVRQYQKRPVPWDKIRNCLEAMRQAPSACNKQPWHAVVVDDPVILEALCKAAFTTPPSFNAFSSGAPVMAAILAETDILTHEIFGRLKGIPYYLLDCGAAIENFLLQAEREGLGTCWLGWFNEKGVRKILKIPRKFKIVSLVTIGFPDEEKKRARARKDAETIYSRNIYGK